MRRVLQARAVRGCGKARIKRGTHCGWLAGARRAYPYPACRRARLAELDAELVLAEQKLEEMARMDATAVLDEARR